MYIRYWRNHKNERKDMENDILSDCYIDAYQSVRISLFGELLK